MDGGGFTEERRRGGMPLRGRFLGADLVDGGAPFFLVASSLRFGGEDEASRRQGKARGRDAGLT
jgi:hypothetical protein